MCKPAEAKIVSALASTRRSSALSRDPSPAPPATADNDEKVPIQEVLEPPTALARYTCVAILVGILGVWGKLAFSVDEASIPDARTESIVHSGAVPVGMTVFYLVSLPLLRMFTTKFLSQVNVKLLLHETMILYNVAQVLLNGWMVYRIIDALLFRDHPFIYGPVFLVDTGATYAVYVHYFDKYLEYLDTYFMVLRGRMDQVSFLHIYHHASIACAWWVGLKLYPGGDIYFGALINSWIHVMMYSYYTLALLKIQCPWKKYLTMAQLAQFCSVIVYSLTSMINMPEEGTWKQYVGHGVQDFEMTSLFLLFMHFYRKAYRKKNVEKRMRSSGDSETTPEMEEQDSVSSVSSSEQSD